eukprot:257861-Pyramimonas_sp.AAC.1
MLLPFLGMSALVLGSLFFVHCGSPRQWLFWPHAPQRVLAFILAILGSSLFGGLPPSRLAK